MQNSNDVTLQRSVSQPGCRGTLDAIYYAQGCRELIRFSIHQPCAGKQGGATTLGFLILLILYT